ncbi:MAG: nitroreductase [Clostridiales bacterium]|nr:nitroreductase [Clostridiales bacterium]
MTTYDIMVARRSIRKFKQDPIAQEVLERAVNVARLAPCGGNMQSLKFCIVQSPELVKGIFAHSKWGMHLPDGSGRPKEGEEPTAWVLILNDKRIREQAFVMDIGAAAENIIIYALSEGIASCWLENLQRPEIAALLELPEHLQLHSAIALGYPGMEAKEVALPASGDTKYFWGEQGGFCVPKRSLDEVMLIK